ncbi:MAG: 2-dehydro-3-deoxygluconokinase [Verrucomicrobiales bacterium]|nr:2-dehydro-3-deoxygluconokinase [Verrucomicrobiales bacterium]
MSLNFLQKQDCEFDLLTLGECMVRLAPPGHGRLEFARTLEVDVGGGEFNVGYACSRLGLRTGFISKLPDNPMGRIILNHARAVGMDVSNVLVEPYDGVGREGRVGLNFTEVGTSVRPSVTVYDRAHSAISAMRPGEIDWNHLFGKRKTRWFHTGGIMTALSECSAGLVKEALTKAREHNAVTSYDLNFRSKLWSSKKAIEVTREIIPQVQVLIGNEEDFQKVLGLKVETKDDSLRNLSIDAYKKMVEQVVSLHPQLKVVCTTLREVTSGLVNNWGAILWVNGNFYEARPYTALEIEDRVGGGDGFSSGVIYGYLAGLTPREIVDFGTAHGALLQTTRGDTSQVTLEEVMHVMRGGSARIQR